MFQKFAKLQQEFDVLTKECFLFIRGNDGEEHTLPVAYYYVDVTVPSVLPDGVS